MGCTPSKVRPTTATDDKKKKKPLTLSVPSEIKYKRTNSGRLIFQEGAEETSKAEKEAWPPQETTRELGKGKLGITSKRKMAKKLNRLSSGHLYQDTQFPPTDESLFFNSDRVQGQLKWKSPRQLCAEPKLLVDGVSRDDIMQGALGDCWFLSSCAVIAQNKELMRKVVPDQQPLYGDGYKGVVRFKFWRFGEWVDVFVDDLLPTQNEQLVYARCADDNEFWVSLMEKAYAKLHGCYEAIEGGQSMDALVDLTGGIAERHEIKNYSGRKEEQLFTLLRRAIRKPGAFITCSKEGSYKGNVPHKSSTGLIAGHAYSVTGAQKVKYKNREENLIRVRNPWGTGQEWTGAWADDDHRWKQIDSESRSAINFRGKEDGEWWMACSDFREHFQEVTVCTLGPDFDMDLSQQNEKANLMIIHGKWVNGESAGGCRNDIRGFATNPQYLLTVLEKDDDEDDACSVLVGLMQEHRRSQRHKGVKMLQIAFLIYETPDPSSRLDATYLERHQEVGRSGTYVNFREVVGRFELKPGNYVIIPSTYDRHQPGSFLIRVYSAKKVGLKLLDSSGKSRTDDVRNGRRY